MGNRNKISDKILISLYDNYNKMGVDDFRNFCRKLVAEARQPNDSILSKIDRMSKDQLVTAVSNFSMKGSGYGVLR